MKRLNLSYLLLPVLIFFSCSKTSSFLDARPDQSLIVPTTITDCQQLLDNDLVMNGYGYAGYPSLGETGCDDYYVTSSQYAGYSSADQNAVIWAPHVYTGGEMNDWDLPYRVIFYANEVIEVLNTLHPSDGELADWNNARGMADFFHGFALYQLAQLFSPAYDSVTAATAPGLPLRMSADVSEKIYRATVQQTYDQILLDIGEAARLLPANPDWYPTRPSKAAAYGLLSRVYLSTRNYPQAMLYADSCLHIHPALMDYNTIDATATLPFTRTNPEVIFGAAYLRSGPTAIGRSITDSLLFNSYAPEDLRKKLFFKNGPVFFGRYDEDGYAFGGIASDEMYLIRSECKARSGLTTAAMDDLNALLTTRWTSNHFSPYTAVSPEDALQQVLTERRKELLYRGLRWTDLRRLNKEPGHAITIYRTVNGQSYSLPSADNRYTYLIPDNVIALHPGMPQNPR